MLWTNRLSLAFSDLIQVTKLNLNSKWLKAQTLLVLQANLFPEEEDVENWFFGDSTVSAVLTYQVRSNSSICPLTKLSIGI